MNKNILSDKIEKALELRSELFSDDLTDCYRIFNAGGDGLDGLTIEYYAGFILVQYFNKSAENILDQIKAAVISAAGRMPVPVRGILLKNRMTVNGDADFEELRKSVVIEGDCPDEEIVVIQNGIKAYADLMRGQNTGVFLDMREVRGRLKSFYAESSVAQMLNLFSYTGMFSTHALCSGVSASVNVDLSRAVLKRAKRNYSLNGLSVDERDFIYGDAIEWIKIFNKKRKKFDFIIFDPPTFARNKKGQFSVKRDYAGALNKLGSLAGEGFVLTSVNSYSVTEAEYRSFHPSGWDLLMFSNESSDFINKGNPYLKAGLWKI